MADRRKLKSLILYVAKRMQGAVHFGSTKLNKALFNSEAAVVRLTGSPITGFRYQKNRFGPTLLAYTHVTDEMRQEGLLTIQSSDHEEDRVEATAEPNMTLFSAVERNAIDSEIDKLYSLTAREASDRSHEAAGWWATKRGDTIDWSLAFVEDPGTPFVLSSRDEERARAAATRFLRRSAVSAGSS